VFHVYHQYTVRVNARDEVQRELAAKGVGTTVYYPIPLHLQPVFSQLGHAKGDLPKSEKASDEALSLPMFPELTVEEQVYVIDQVRDAARAYPGL